MSRSRTITVLRRPYYEGEGQQTAQQTGANVGNQTPPTAGASVDPNAGQQTQPLPLPKLFNEVQQAEVNRLLADERKRHEGRTAKAIEQLEELKKNQNLTDQERTRLSQQIDEMRSQIQTKEQQAQSEIHKLTTRYNNDTKTLSEERNAWRQRFERTTMQHDLAAAASSHEALSVEQIEAILLPQTKVVEELGEDGKPTGNHVARVSFTGRDKEGKSVKLELSPFDAVKAMREWPERYGNLFKNPANSGLGANPNNGSVNGSRIPDLDGLTPQQYLQNRGKIREELARK